MKNYSETKTYQNGNKVLNGEDGDHVAVRQLIKNKVVQKVDNFGPLLSKETATTFIETDGLEKVIAGDYELFVKPSTSYAIDFTTGQSTSMEGWNNVYYQRISK